MSATADINSNISSVARVTLGACSPYSECTECQKPNAECPNMVIENRQCACGQPLTQSDLWHAEEDGVLTCRYCRPAATYINDLLEEARDAEAPVSLESLWQTSPWRPEYTQQIVSHLRSAGINIEESTAQQFSPWKAETPEMQ